MGLRHAAMVAGLALGLISGAAKAAIIFNDTTPGATTLTVGPGTYIFTLTGASGGATSFYSGGLGAVATYTYQASASETFDVLVGAMGTGGGDAEAGGGGGGTFVAMAGNAPYFVAGGGGGASVFMDGGNSTSSVSGGGGGGSAGGAPGQFGGAGGGGFDTAGSPTYFSGVNGGAAYVEGGAGGSGARGANGGIGGGGGGGVVGGGGGGGFDGGNGGGEQVGQTSGGGTSLIYASDQVLSLAGAAGDGSLLVSSISTVPLPASAPMFGAALMVLGAVGYGLKRKSKAAA